MIQGNAILTIIRKKKLWNKAEKFAKKVINKPAIFNAKIKQRQQALVYGESYEATREYKLNRRDYKLYTDQKDSLFIYYINENKHI